MIRTTPLRRRWPAAPATFMLVALFLSAAAEAGEGVIEINHTRALEGGVTPGDAPGYPVTIDRAGSYVLTGALGPKSSGAIEITRDGVSLDLNGFRVYCFVLTVPPPPNPCSGEPGISVSASDVTIRNGVISDFGGSGVASSGAVLLEDLRVVDNGGDGIILGGGGLVLRSEVSRNGAVGIRQTQGPRPVSVVDSAIEGNASTGILGAALVRGNRVRGNAGDGISVGPGANVAGNHVSQNSGIGIFASNDARIAGNTVLANLLDGISAGPGSLVIDNVSSQNLGFGLNLTSGAGSARNSMLGNHGAGANPDLFGGTSLGANLCGSGPC